MINVLRIISVIAAILAGVFFVFPIVYGVYSDEQVKEFLEAPEIREKFENAADSRIKSNKNRTSPLVQQAQAFAAYLNPKPETKGISRVSKGSKITNPLPVTPKFKLYCTSYCEDDPNMSLALIDEPGKGRHWVKPSSKVGHLMIEQIQDGLIIVNNGQESFNLAIEESTATKSLPSISKRTGSQARFRSGLTTPSKNILSKSTPKTTKITTSTTSPEDEKAQRDARARALVEKMKAIRQNATSGGTNSGLDDKDKDERLEKLISQFQSTLISPEEAKKLGKLGKTLKEAESEPNQTPSNTGKSK